MPVVLNDAARRIAIDRYFTSEEKDVIEALGYSMAYENMCTRVAEAVSLAESTPRLQTEFRATFKHVLLEQYLIPGGRFWANAGTHNQQFPNCFGSMG